MAFFLKKKIIIIKHKSQYILADFWALVWSIKDQVSKPNISKAISTGTGAE